MESVRIGQKNYLPSRNRRGRRHCRFRCGSGGLRLGYHGQAVRLESSRASRVGQSSIKDQRKLNLIHHQTRSSLFARYLAAPGKGQEHFAKHHFSYVPGDEWEKARTYGLLRWLNRDAVYQTLRDFEKREGCKIVEHFNGCGSLVANIKTVGQSFTPPCRMPFSPATLPHDQVGDLFKARLRNGRRHAFVKGTRRD